MPPHLTLPRGLIVSCQAPPGTPLRDSRIMAALAVAAQVGGAVGIRANGPDDIHAIHAAVDLPLIGLYKQDIPGCEVYITPDIAAAQAVVAAGATIVALDATPRSRPAGVSAADLIRRVRDELGVPVMADISTLPEGVAAAEAGADLVATTMSGYTPYSPQQTAPDFALIEALARRVRVPVVAEGRIATPDDARRALDAGAHAVVVGTAITRPDWITARFVQALSAAS